VIFEKTLPFPRLAEEIQRSRLCVLPSLTEITPNFALECLKLEKPIILTKETGYYRKLKNELVFINPKDPKDVVEKIIFLLDDRNYMDYLERIKNISFNWNWGSVANKHLAIFKEMI